MHILGLTGGIASGKSAVAAELATQGAAVLDADLAAHQVINSSEVRRELVARWGDGILLATGEIDRKAIAERVFLDSAAGTRELDFLEQTLHPRIRDQFEAKLAKFSEDEVAVTVVDAPLLLEAGWENLCDSVVFVDCPRETRLQRALLRRWSADQFAAREAAQMPIEEKKQRATHTISSSGSPQELSSQVRALWNSLGVGKTS